MPLRIFTIPFSEETQTFHDDLIIQFCTNKRVHKIETRFFVRNSMPYWTVAIHYGQILAEEKVRVSGGPADEYSLDDQQKALLIRLKEWRKEEADRQHFPVYLIATNAHLALAIRNKCTTLESLKLIKGFGKAKIEKYGKAVTGIIKTFYQGS